MIKRVSKIKETILILVLFLMSTLSVCAQNQHCNVKGYIVDETKTPVRYNFNSYKANNAMKNAETDRNKVRLGL